MYLPSLANFLLINISNLFYYKQCWYEHPWNKTLKQYLFTYLAVTGLSCSTWDIHSIVRDLSLAVVQGLFSCGTQA